MIRRVYERACAASLVDEVIVATDDERVLTAVRNFGGRAVMTLAAHRSGTDRLAEVAREREDAALFINVQGDEPLIDPGLIDRLALCLRQEPRLPMATAAAPLAASDYDDPAAVKVVTDVQGCALYFSRSLIPYPRETDGFAAYKHIGVYAYRRDFALTFAGLPRGRLEAAESLEQLRALENGYKIKVLRADAPAPGVDTPEDLEKVNEYFRTRGL
jgi:3-deoxy-manno-octulosonate cytidylyltransferase (CMP-KDO synthetase)